MSALHSIKKNIESSSLRFPPEAYNNVIGSFAITCYLLDGDYSDEKTKEIRTKWIKLYRHPEKSKLPWIDESDYMEKWASYFGVKVPTENVAMVQSKYNMLFLPYIGDKLFPIREDGQLPLTARQGKIYPIKFEDK
jgi:hypothetical protein